jgi:prepilin-type N-terminal cleavage/methylation domain-containing protein
MSINNKLKRNRVSGFTLVETLIAIAILLISIAAPLVIISQALKSSYYSRDQITAYYLAQEAIEYIRNLRDVNGLQSIKSSVYSNTWLNGIDSVSNPWLNTYGLSTYKLELVRVLGAYSLRRCVLSGNTKCPPLQFDPNGIYSYGDVAAPSTSNFTREIILSEAPASSYGTTSRDREIVLYVNVYWNTGSIKNSVKIREHLTNWELEKAPN